MTTEEKYKSTNGARQQKRRVRLSARGSILSTASSSGNSFVSTSTLSTIASRLARRETRKRQRKETLRSSTEDIETGTSPQARTIPEEPDVEATEIDEQTQEDEDSVQRSQRQSLYSLPGAFRVSRKLINSRQVDEVALEDVSIDESYLTTKTPPVVIPRASLVRDDCSRTVETSELPIALPSANGLFVTKRHLFICVMLSCIAFGGLFTGVLFALGDGPKESPNSMSGSIEDFSSIPKTDEHLISSPSEPSPPSGVDIFTNSPTQNPTSLIETESPSRQTKKPATASPSPTPTTLPIHSTPSPTTKPTTKTTKSPTNFPTSNPTHATDSPTALPTIAPASFSLTSRPTLSPIASPAIPVEGNSNGNGNGNGNSNGNGNGNGNGSESNGNGNTMSSGNGNRNRG